MKQRQFENSSSDDGHDTDTSDNIRSPVKTDASWSDILVYFNFVPYLGVFYVSWYYLNHNVF